MEIYNRPVWCVSARTRPLNMLTIGSAVPTLKRTLREKKPGCHKELSMN